MREGSWKLENKPYQECVVAFQNKLSPSKLAHDFQLFWFRYDCYKECDYGSQYAIDTRKKDTQDA